MKYLKSFNLFESDDMKYSAIQDILVSRKIDPYITKIFKINLINKAISDASPGVIQDPAGTAIGSNERPMGGGASGAIYRKFDDLEPITSIEPGESVFNNSKGEGKKIIHTHSYKLFGFDPESERDVNIVIDKLAETYYNAIVRFNEKDSTLDSEDQGILNLVPVSAGIFADRFKDNELNHLDPIYTLAAIYIAINRANNNKEDIPELNLYYFDPVVYQAAKNLL